MKFNKKLAAISAAALMAISPVAMMSSTVNAAETQTNQVNITANNDELGKATGTVAIGDHPPVVNRNGQKYTSFTGKDVDGKTLKVTMYGENHALVPETIMNFWGKAVMINGREYFRIGKNAYVEARFTAKVNGPASLTVDKNSYIYNKNGKRMYNYNGKRNAKIKKGSIVASVSKTADISKERNYFGLYIKSYANNSGYERVKFWLPYKKINGKLFYAIGKGGYIRCTNVSKINGQDVLVPEATVTLKRNTTAYDIKENRTKLKLKKGQKVRVDQEILNAGEGYFYRIKNKKNSYIDVSDCYKLKRKMFVVFYKVID